MGTSTKMVDCGFKGDTSVGTLVWVRRRNGSWWPGKILGVEESNGCFNLQSPKVGTPIKLLGRDDASVGSKITVYAHMQAKSQSSLKMIKCISRDWYNLEKSRRVKLFRCGDFDEFIEKVKTSRSKSVKKKTKYARREDAIRHALQLEREMLEKNKPKSKPSSNRTLQMVLRNSLQTSRKSGSNLNSLPISKKINSSVKDRSAKNGKSSGHDNLSPKAITRTDFQDTGTKIATSKRKATCSSVPNDGPETTSLSENQVHILSDHVDNNKDSLSVKRQRKQVSLHKDTYAKNPERLNPLAKVTRNSAKSPNNLQTEESETISPGKRSRSQLIYVPTASNNDVPLEPVEISSLPQICTDNEHPPDSLTEKNISSGLIDVVDSSPRDILDTNMDKEKAVLVDPSLFPAVTVSLNSPKSLDNCLVLCQQETIKNDKLDVNVSKWQIKGKRNIRPSTKKPTEEDEISTKPTVEDEISTELTEEDETSTNSDEAMHESPNEWDPLEQDSDEDFEEDSLSDDSDGLPPVIRKRNWSSDYSRRNFKSQLVNVVLTVQKSLEGELQLPKKSHQGEHVPLVSLMSRLNGKAIVGHPIQIEKLEDGSTSNLLNSSNDLVPVWRTGRRTTMPRLPRSNPPTTFHDNELDDPPYTDIFGSLRWKLPTKGSSWNQKKKSLSSIGPGSSKSINGFKGKHVNSFDSLIKPNARPTTVTCIPVKLVFSRLLEVLGRSPSA